MSLYVWRSWRDLINAAMLSRFPCWNGYNDWVEKYQLMENTATATTMKIS